MPGVKGKSGGQRPGAGRPVAKRSLRVTNEFVVVRHLPDGGWELPQTWRVKELSHNLIVIENVTDGSEIRMVG